VIGWKIRLLYSIIKWNGPVATAMAGRGTGMRNGIVPG
jgi:hypothetical protein